MARKWMYEKIMAMPGRNELLGDRVMSSGSAGDVAGPGDSPGRPFIVIRSAVKQMPGHLRRGATRQQRLDVYLHTDPGSMLDTDDFLEEMSKWLPDQAPSASADEVVSHCEWENTSGDGYDDHYRTAVRYATFLCTYRSLRE